MSCWPGHVGLVRRESLTPIPAAASVDLFLIPESFDVSGGGDIEELRSWLDADGISCDSCCNLNKLDDITSQMEEYLVFRRRDEYILAIHEKGDS